MRNEGRKVSPLETALFVVADLVLLALLVGAPKLLLLLATLAGVGYVGHSLLVRRRRTLGAGNDYEQQMRALEASERELDAQIHGRG